MGASHDPSMVAAHNNLIRAMAFASEHQVEPTESGLNNDNSKYFSYQPWSRYKIDPSQHLGRIKALIQYRQFQWSASIQMVHRPLEIYSESDEEIQPKLMHNN
eukprot:10669029-Heterocapsa_arctica.AAC.1